ncbi:hypothetical protein CKM354_000413000 [Cercospora kikuchii]|uniref:A-kinase anchor protein 7-like phosphoesterase domain-containing protein n=1 Tax=Cercospora kikuchii TaxID=84275 RepID=A0A9P3CFE3_9PEZI|nr:uncharacterized protein CKM354_000413000 [Cercospora kikuchii]GIZ40806.1 hypothetical protein CKM354_000413000 [Cercospora kikuchii]
MGRPRGAKHSGAAKKPPLTHFLCLPLVTPASRPQLEHALQAFRQDVSSTSAKPASSAEQQDDIASPNIHPKAIRPTGSLHLTLGVMSLSQEQLVRATECLEKLDFPSLLTSAESTATQGIRITLQGLQSMHAPEKTSILYAEPADATDRLYPLCLALQKSFKEEGFLVEDSRPLKLHATVVNTIYAKGRKKPTQKPVTITSDGRVLSASAGESSEDRSQGHGPTANAPLKIDSRALLARYKDHVWASIDLDRIAICEMGTKKITAADGTIIDAQYTEVASALLPP